MKFETNLLQQPSSFRNSGEQDPLHQYRINEALRRTISSLSLLNSDYHMHCCWALLLQQEPPTLWSSMFNTSLPMLKSAQIQLCGYRRREMMDMGLVVMDLTTAMM